MFKVALLIPTVIGILWPNTVPVDAALYLTGAVKINITSAPHMASFDSCGATIIGQKHILTAAHCVFEDSVRSFVKTGATIKGEGEKHEIKSITTHPLWNDTTMEYDFAVITLKEPIVFDINTKPIRIAHNETQVPDKARLEVTGWGNLNEGVPASDRHLRWVSVPKYNQKECEKDYKSAKSIYKVTDAMLCAGYKRGEKDACQGDSGGPLVYNKIQVGVVSWGLGCGRKNTPGVYARVSLVAEWIQSILNE